MKFILLMNVKMPTIVAILIFISRINTSYEYANIFSFKYFIFYEQLKSCSAEMSMKKRFTTRPDPEIIKLSCSTHMSMKF